MNFKHTPKKKDGNRMCMFKARQHDWIVGSLASCLPAHCLMHRLATLVIHKGIVSRVTLLMPVT